MSTTVSIPEGTRPLIVTVNGHRYRFLPGTQEVPDDVAEVIMHAAAMAPASAHGNASAQTVHTTGGKIPRIVVFDLSLDGDKFRITTEEELSATLEAASDGTPIIADVRFTLNGAVNHMQGLLYCGAIDNMITGIVMDKSGDGTLLAYRLRWDSTGAFIVAYAIQAEAQ